MNEEGGELSLQAGCCYKRVVATRLQRRWSAYTAEVGGGGLVAMHALLLSLSRLSRSLALGLALSHPGRGSERHGSLGYELGDERVRAVAEVSAVRGLRRAAEEGEGALRDGMDGCDLENRGGAKKG